MSRLRSAFGALEDLFPRFLDELREVAAAFRWFWQVWQEPGWLEIMVGVVAVVGVVGLVVLFGRRDAEESGSRRSRRVFWALAAVAGLVIGLVMTVTASYYARTTPEERAELREAYGKRSAPGDSATTLKPFGPDRRQHGERPALARERGNANISVPTIQGWNAAQESG